MTEHCWMKVRKSCFRPCCWCTDCSRKGCSGASNNTDFSFWHGLWVRGHRLIPACCWQNQNCYRCKSRNIHFTHELYLNATHSSNWSAQIKEPNSGFAWRPWTQVDSLNSGYEAQTAHAVAQWSTQLQDAEKCHQNVCQVDSDSECGSRVRFHLLA